MVEAEEEENLEDAVLPMNNKIEIVSRYLADCKMSVKEAELPTQPVEEIACCSHRHCLTTKNTNSCGLTLPENPHHKTRLPNIGCCKTHTYDSDPLPGSSYKLELPKV